MRCRYMETDLDAFWALAQRNLLGLSGDELVAVLS